MVCYVSLGAQTRACELARQLDSEDVFSSLGRVIWYQWRGEHERAVEITDRLLKKPMMPRFEVLAMVLQAASLCSQRSLGAAQNVLQMAWRSYRAPRLMRFAFRFVPPEIADELISAVEQDLSGGLPDALSAMRNDPRPFIWSKRPALTRSELEILNMLRKGLSNSEIARQRFVVIGTLRNQLKSIYRKLEVADRHEAVDAAYRLGFFGPRDGDDEAGV
ncbi:LuxR C-terminal-related transcriptional regulator [Actinomycetaceae bacterium MB13-C1-2]|nr:LuxR C-terminal-related transcriptional regulator [Actinomycetaceae bacterium MB13-C1-2]